MNKYSGKKPMINEGLLPINPFIDDLVIKVSRHSYEAGGKQIDMDMGRHCKLFISPDNRKRIAKLSGGAKSLFFWIMQEVEGGRDYLWVNKMRYMEENEIKTKKTMEVAIDELIESGFIAPAGRYIDVYFINPSFIFNGARRVKFPECVDRNWEEKEQLIENNV